jgi:hypothetical protein
VDKPEEKGEQVEKLTAAVAELKVEVKSLAEKRDAEAREKGAASEKTARDLDEKYTKLVERSDELKAELAKTNDKLAAELAAERQRVDELERKGGRPDNVRGEGAKTFGQLFVESERFEAMKKGGSTTCDPVSVAGGYRPSLTKTLLDTGQMTPQAIREPLLPAVERELRLSDLFAQVAVSVPAGEYYEETGFNAGTTAAVTSITQSAGLATITMAAAHGWGAVGQQVRVTVAGANQAGYNGTHSVKITSATVGTYAVDSGTVSPATGTIVAYLNQTHGAAAMTAEGSALPEARMQFGLVQWQAKTLGHWLPMTKQFREDNAQMAAYVDNRLMYGLDHQVETAQLLYGDGTGENLPGILNNSRRQSYAWSDGATLPVPDTKIDALRKAMTRSLIADYMPNGIAVHPFDWQDIELAKGTDGHYLTMVTVDNAGMSRFFRVPVVVTPNIAFGTSLVGSFGRAAEIKDLQQVEIEVSKSHSDDFIKLREVVRATKRLGLAVYRPESFVEVTFDAAPS